jgi:murein DD-endopeptidase MepM/ murein hydrolase activator NlpD
MASNAAQKKVFQVAQQVRVRAQPSRSAAEIKQIPAGQRLQVDASSRTEAENFVWWKHVDGWSAERSLDGKDVFLVEVVETPAASAPAVSATSGTTSAAPAVKKTFRVNIPIVHVRNQPSTQASLVKDLTNGTLVDVDANSRTEAEGYAWWKHADGWSVERKTDNSEVYLIDPATAPPPPPTPTSVFGSDGLPDVTKLPLLNGLFTRPPVPLDQTDWTQYFGNTQFAFENGRNWGYDKFAQGLHSGVDFGTMKPAGLPIFAGAQGVFLRQDRYGVHVNVGDYHIIYQHIVNAPPFAPNSPISPDTQLGTMEPLPGNVHLHLEVRYKERWIINSLLYFPEVFRASFMGKFKNFERYFCKANGWTLWQSPLDQPVIVLAGPVIGPSAYTK